MDKAAKGKSKVNFESMLQSDVPTGRNGKHKNIVTRILSDLEQLGSGRALRIALSELPDTKENIRSALSRATKQLQIEVATSSDDQFFYVWNVEQPAE